MSVKVGISLPKELANEVEKIMKLLGIENRSKVINEALKMYINNLKQFLTNQEVVSVVVLMYDDKISGSRISDIRHQYKNLVVTLSHVDGVCDKCLELMLVKGPSQKIAEFLGKLYLVDGIEKICYMPIAILENNEHTQK